MVTPPIPNGRNGIHRRSAGTHQHSSRFRTLATPRLDCALQVRSSTKPRYPETWIKVGLLIPQPPRNRVACCPRIRCTNMSPPWTSPPASDKMTRQMNNRSWRRPWEKSPLTKTISSSRASAFPHVNLNTNPSHQCHGSHRHREEYCQ